MVDFEKKYDMEKGEEEIKRFWQEEEIFKFDETSKKPLFLIDTPPPTVSGKMHIGHAFSYTQTDFIARYKRMSGFNVFYPFGTDDNGLATEKLVQKEMKTDLRKVKREDAVKITCEYLDKTREGFIEDFRRVGLSCDFDNLNYSTIEFSSQKICQETFLELAKKNLVYRKRGPIPWDRVFQTTIAQAELEDREVKSKMCYIKAELQNRKNEFVIFATTRPEMIFAVLGFSIEEGGSYVKLKVGEEFWILGQETHREVLEGVDENFEVVENLSSSSLLGEKVLIPLINREIEITYDEIIKSNFGTGCAYFCSYGGVEDIEYIKRHNLKPLDILNKDGTLNSLCGKFEGLIASEEGRFSVIRKLKEMGSLIKTENIKHIVNVGERSGVEVEYVSSVQWFVKYLDKKDYFLKMAKKFNWFPNFMRKRLENWIEGLNWDWGFSRQRHFGVPIPIWYCEDCGEIIYADKKQLPVDTTITKPPIEKCPKCSSEKFRGEEDVFDTWFSSASTPTISLNCVKDENLKKKMFPFDLRPQAHDIINFWLFYSMAKSNLLYEKNPFNSVAISGWMLDEEGRKMSKSKGNTISPQKIIEKFCADGLRFLSSSSKLGFDIPFKEKEILTGVKVINKLYNAHKFAKSIIVETFEPNLEYQNLFSVDKWILAKMQEVIKISINSFENYDYERAKSAFVSFFLKDVCDNYLEIVKQRLWQKKRGLEMAQNTLYVVLFNCVRGLAPILPFICEEVYRIFYSNFEKEKSIHLCKFPQISNEFENSSLIDLGDKLCEVIGKVRKYKAERKLSMNSELSKLVVCCDDKLENFIKENLEDLETTLHFKKIEFKRSDEIDIDVPI